MQKTPKREEIMFQLLKHGAEDLLLGGGGLTYDDLRTNLQELGYQVITADEHQEIWEIIRESFVYPNGIGGDCTYYLSLESLFYLLDHLETTELEDSSQYAA